MRRAEGPQLAVGPPQKSAQLSPKGGCCVFKMESMIERGGTAAAGQHGACKPEAPKGGPPSPAILWRHRPEEKEMIEIWLQTIVLIALAYAFTTLVFHIKQVEKQFTLGLKWGLNSGARWLIRPAWDDTEPVQDPFRHQGSRAPQDQAVGRR